MCGLTGFYNYKHAIIPIDYDADHSLLQAAGPKQLPYKLNATRASDAKNKLLTIVEAYTRNLQLSKPNCIA